MWIGLIDNVIKFIKFSLVGVINTLVSIVLFNIFLWMNMNYIIANIISYCIGILNSYALNSKWSFKSEYSKKTFLKFAGVNVIILVLNTCILTLGVNVLGLSPTLGQIIATGLGVVIGFILNKFFVF